MTLLRRIRYLLVRSMLIFPLITGVIPAKTRHTEGASTSITQSISPSAILSLERRLSPFFENRIARRHANKEVAGKTAAPNESDLMALSKAWHLLSPQFKALYQKAASIPDSTERYNTPGGHFEIYYTTSGINGVDTTDTCSFTASNWRERIGQPNGIPDYIDETAYALDSTWSMEIDRFGFIPPRAYVDANHASDRYKVVVELQDDSYYGLTYLQAKPTDVHGFPSTISLRNNWPESEWSELGYDRNPASGIRVTCAHEFFHAIQYGMSWEVDNDVWLDDFPLSWTEGTAASMEELAFDSINDYVQYATTYFKKPDMPFFSPTTSDMIYSNVILLLYLYKFFPPGNSIEFTRSMLFANYTKRTPFHLNLWTTAVNSATSWNTLLHNFHVASLFTGSHADTARFITDAPHFSMSSVSVQPFTNSLTRNVDLNSAKLIRLLPDTFSNDTLSFAFNGEAPSLTSKVIGCGWACSILLRKGSVDSIVTIALDTNSRGVAAIPLWQTFDEAIIVITNSDPLSSRNVSLVFSTDTIRTSTEPIVFPNPVSVRRHRDGAHVRGENITSVSIRSIDGSLIWSKTVNRLNPQEAQEVLWNCKTTSGRPISPGTYLVLITRNDDASGSIAHARRKLLVIP